MLITAWDIPIWREAGFAHLYWKKVRQNLTKLHLFGIRYQTLIFRLTNRRPVTILFKLPSICHDALCHTLGPFFLNRFGEFFWWNATEDLLHFLHHIHIQLKRSSPQSAFEGQKQPEVAEGEIRTIGWMHDHVSVVALKPVLNEMSRMWPSIVVMQYPLPLKFWPLSANVLLEFLENWHVIGT